MAELAYKDEARYEKINGQWIMMSPARAEHVITVGNIYYEYTIRTESFIHFLFT